MYAYIVEWLCVRHFRPRCLSFTSIQEHVGTAAKLTQWIAKHPADVDQESHVVKMRLGQFNTWFLIAESSLSVKLVYLLELVDPSRYLTP